MNPYERRIIHTTVQKVNGAISWSEGEDLARHVVIGPDPEYKPAYRNPRGGQNRGGNKGGYRRNSRPPREGGKPAAASQQPREPKKEAPSASLYGRIDLPKKENE